MVGYLESGEDEVQTIELPGSIVRYRVIEAHTAKGIDRAIESFSAQVVAAGAQVYAVSRWKSSVWAYVVVYYHSEDLDVKIPHPEPETVPTPQEALEDRYYREDVIDTFDQAQRLWND